MGVDLKEVAGSEGLLTFDDLSERVRRYLPDSDLALLDKAFRFSRLAHEGQRRRSGEEFIQHPLAVACILAELELDEVTLAAALLHDVVEDTEVTLEQIEAEFGPEITGLVDGVTKLGKLHYRSRMEFQADNLRKMFLAMARDIRVILIKLADRLHNMRTLGSLPEEKQREIAEETLEIFAPLAHRLGIFRFKWELEDLAFRYLEPEAYRDLARRIPGKRREREEMTRSLMDTLRARLAEAGIRADIQGRAKHLFSIYGKMRKGKELNEIYDLLAVRVIVDSIRDCYAVLGIVHALWKPIPGRFKDYIATPKSNMYQSLHTTVVGPHGEPVEIQIRTVEMHRTAEYGIAAHWRYKEGGRGDRDFDRKLSWLREILEWQKDLRDAREFMESLKIDMFTDEVFVFTPKGDVIDLPAGSTPIDFAYRIHSEVGHRCVGAKINGRIASLDTPLKNGDIVEILTSKSAPGPSVDWLNIAKTSNAKNRIRQWFKREKREENLVRGRDLVEREIRRNGWEADSLLREEWLEEIRKRLNLPTVEEMFVSVGFGGISAAQVVGRLRDFYLKEQEKRAALEPPRAEAARPGPPRARSKRPGGEGVSVRGIDNVLVRFPRCCSPVPGDDIIGYVSRGRGVAVHRRDCPSLAEALKDESQRGRLIDVSWNAGDSRLYAVEICVHALDRPGLLSDVARAVAENHINILYSRTWARDHRRATIDLVLEVRDLGQLEAVAKRIEKVRDVLSVERVSRQAR